MKDSKILQKLSKKQTNVDKVAKEVMNNPKLLHKTFEGITSDKAKVKFDEIIDKYYSFIDDLVMVTAAHVVGHSGKIAKSRIKKWDI